MATSLKKLEGIEGIFLEGLCSLLLIVLCGTLEGGVESLVYALLELVRGWEEAPLEV